MRVLYSLFIAMTSRFKELLHLGIALSALSGDPDLRGLTSLASAKVTKKVGGDLAGTTAGSVSELEEVFQFSKPSGLNLH